MLQRFSYLFVLVYIFSFLLGCDRKSSATSTDSIKERVSSETIVNTTTPSNALINGNAAIKGTWALSFAGDKEMSFEVSSQFEFDGVNRAQIYRLSERRDGGKEITSTEYIYSYFPNEQRIILSKPNELPYAEMLVESFSPQKIVVKEFGGELGKRLPLPSANAKFILQPVDREKIMSSLVLKNGGEVIVEPLKGLPKASANYSDLVGTWQLTGVKENIKDAYFLPFEIEGSPVPLTQLTFGEDGVGGFYSKMNGSVSEIQFNATFSTPDQRLMMGKTGKPLQMEFIVDSVDSNTLIVKSFHIYQTKFIKFIDSRYIEKKIDNTSLSIHPLVFKKITGPFIASMPLPHIDGIHYDFKNFVMMLFPRKIVASVDPHYKFDGYYVGDTDLTMSFDKNRDHCVVKDDYLYVEDHQVINQQIDGKVRTIKEDLKIVLKLTNGLTPSYLFSNDRYSDKEENSIQMQKTTFDENGISIEEIEASSKSCRYDGEISYGNVITYKIYCNLNSKLKGRYEDPMHPFRLTSQGTCSYK